MAKAKEIKIKWVHDNTVGGRIYFANAEMNECFTITAYGAPDEKVLKAKAWIKTYLPQRAEEFLMEHPGWKQVDEATYDIAYSNRKMR